jgi:hypothetical protein
MFSMIPSWLMNAMSKGIRVFIPQKEIGLGFPKWNNIPLSGSRRSLNIRPR